MTFMCRSVQHLPGLCVYQIVCSHSQCVYFGSAYRAMCNIKNAHALNYLGSQWVFSCLCTKHKRM